MADYDILVENLKNALSERLRRQGSPRETLNPFTLKGTLRTLDCYPPPATDQDFQAFSDSTDITLPEDIVSWLRVSNGPAGFFGLASAQAGCRVNEVWSAFPTWRERRWFPVARDDFGNYYVSPMASPSPVCFVESLDPDRLAYAVASNVLHFACFALQAEAESQEHHAWKEWPWSEHYALSHDPELIQYLAAFKAPWETDGVDRHHA